MKVDLAGLWKNNPALVQMLGLCPLLATSNNLINGFCMGIATTLVLIITAGIISSIKSLITPEIRLPSFMLIIASSVTIIEIIIQTYFYDLYLILGIFIPLIVTNCIIVARIETFSSKERFFPSILDALIMGFGFTWVLVCLGGIREILGQGTLFSGINYIFGESSKHLVINISDHHFLLAALPAGAFIIFGFLLATKQIIDEKIKSKTITNTDSTLVKENQDSLV